MAKFCLAMRYGQPNAIGLWPQLPRLCDRVSIGMLVFARVIPTQRLKWASATTTYPWMSVDNSLYVNKHNKAGFINNYYQLIDNKRLSYYKYYN
ncbi:hypothetical protein [Moorena sp. SIO3I8]|uniref:hypothetical protein n=1 Tax=Moorena sp. SIO3I8 TaxID=2607833 RepID=UPI0013C103FE|nr:hypothetical protein [Moorena sp. SIO3I8]NEO06261.1 hypothetical protein [Moorena sp. SIO3I8]